MPTFSKLRLPQTLCYFLSVVNYVPVNHPLRPHYVYANLACQLRQTELDITYYQSL